MRLRRQLLAAAILALYIAQVVGGPSVHLWHCPAGEASCCVEAAWRSTTIKPRDHQHPHGHCCHHAGDCEDEPREDGHEPGKHRQHDPGKCWICQVLGQAQERSTELPMPASMAVCWAPVIDAPDFYRALTCSGFDSRAPPAEQA